MERSRHLGIVHHYVAAAIAFLDPGEGRDGILGGESYVALAEGLQNALWALVMTASTCSSAPPR